MRRFGWICCTVMLLGTAAPAGAETLAEVKARLAASQAKIVNGVFEANYPTVGALLLGNDPESASTYCSGTLIGCQTFLTAGHCVEGNTAGDYTVFLANAGFFSVASITLHPSYEFPLMDSAVITLGAPVDGIAPTPINTGATPAIGSTGTIVGFGRSGGSNYDYGLKRRGSIETAACVSDPDLANSVCWQFSAPTGPPGTNSNTCNADSGGPLFIDFGAGNRVAGTTSGGSSSGCSLGDASFDLDISKFTSFIQGAGGADLANTSCGSLPQVGAPHTTVSEATGNLSSGVPDGVHSFTVAPGTTTLRVAMTGSEEFGSDFDLYVRYGSAPTTLVYDCRDIGSGQYNYCEIASPTSGTWYVLAHRFAGLGAYQVTLTGFQRDCSQPGDEGLACDDDDVCTTADACTAGVCAGTPAGNGTPCDDGNACTTPDTCESGSCSGTPAADGAPCDDGSHCSSPDTCQAGFCVGTVPAASCKLPFIGGKAFLQLKDRTPDTGDRLTWKWLRGAQTAKTEFGDPTSTTDYWLCVYDETAGVPSRIIEQQIPAGSLWSVLPLGFRFHDTNVTQSGISSVLLRSGDDGIARILVKGKSLPLDLPPLDLHQDTKVTVQLLNDTACWQANYSTNLRDDTEQFRAKAD